MATSPPDRRLPTGHQPYDPANGLRVGALVGALAGASLTAIFGPALAWSVLAGAGVGAAVGFEGERRRLRRAKDRPTR